MHLGSEQRPLFPIKNTQIEIRESYDITQFQIESTCF